MKHDDIPRVTQRALNDRGHRDALKAPGAPEQPARIACLSHKCPSGDNYGTGDSPEWLCDGIVPYDLIGGIHFIETKPATVDVPYYNAAAHERIKFYWEVDFSGTVHLLPPRLLFAHGDFVRLDSDLSNRGLLRAYLNGFRSGVADRKQAR